MRSSQHIVRHSLGIEKDVINKIYHFFSRGVAAKTFEIKKILSQQVVRLVRCSLDVEKHGINKIYHFFHVV